MEDLVIDPEHPNAAPLVYTGDTFTFTVTPDDLMNNLEIGALPATDPGDTFTWSIEGGGDFSIDSTTGILYAQGTPSPGKHTFWATVTDDSGANNNSDEAYVTVNVGGGLPPQIANSNTQDGPTNAPLSGVEVEVIDWESTGGWNVGFSGNITDDPIVDTYIIEIDLDGDGWFNPLAEISYTIVPDGQSVGTFSSVHFEFQTNIPSGHYPDAQMRPVAAVDGAGDWVSISLSVEQQVGLTGDTHVIEGLSDTLQITFVRIGADFNQPLDVEYQVDWGDVTPQADLSPQSEITMSSSGIVHFEAGEKTATLDVLAIADGVLEIIEKFTVTVVDGQEYDLVGGGRNFLDNYGGDFIHTTAHAELTYSILDGVTLFAGINEDPILDDGGGDIHPNDVDQGLRPDCFALAAIAALALRGEYLLNRLLVEAKGTVTVTFEGGSFSKVYTYEEILSRGMNASMLTGDYDNQGRVEVWVQVLELALIDHLDGCWYGTTHEVWTAVTGVEPTHWTSPFNQNPTISGFIDEWHTNNGDPVALETALVTQVPSDQMPIDFRDTLGGGVSNPRRLLNKHTYLFLEWKTVTTPNGGEVEVAVLYNPHGAGNEIWIHSADLTSPYFNEVLGLERPLL